MKAVVVRRHGGPEVLEVTDVPVPPVGPGDVRIAVRSIALNFRDVQQRRGASADQPLPFTPGSDLAGEIVEVGADVTDVAVGDQVFSITLSGAYAEQVVVPAGMATPLPPGTDHDHGAILPVAGLSASFLVSTSGIGKGQTAVTWAAAGGLGCFLGGLLAQAGVRTIGLTSSEDKAAVARAAGHSDVVLYRDVDPVEAVHELTGGKGADVVFDSVGGPDFARSFRMTRNEGTVVLCGRSAGQPDLGQVADAFLGGRRNLALREFYLGTHVFDHLDELPGRFAQLSAGLRDGTVTVPITAFALDDVQDAHARLEGGGTTGKVVLHP